MEVSKKLFSQLLSEFSGEYREIFFEKSISTQIAFFNGESNMSSAASSGASFLSRADGIESFFSASDVDDYQSTFAEVKKTLPAQSPTPVLLSGPDIAILRPVLQDEYVERVARWGKEATQDLRADYLQSYEFVIRCVHKAFVV